MRLKTSLLAALILPLAVLSACTTTEDANRALQSRWIGQPVERFFAAYGPPINEYPLSSGTIYTWRGGDKTRYIPPTYSSPEPARTTVRTETRTDSAGKTVVTQTRVVTRDPFWEPEMISPPQYQQLFCELQINTDKAGVIATIRASNDTDGDGFSLSRCAEVLGVEKQ
ncbi:hypothetical protein J2045_004597 [Peteryoungia aggregata LMG 23059]|uniref:Lipoprotein n=1 Tax=Peteryoungia aggregata LMG 23059 TaxID=1368425 RepID=A0ABU0GDV3_9HYPH|nr:hypothetical protein [Peteryoungia aggregata]MDQ0423545.1 hypothetical protein [Peteryoungia aggregata LMG 23059]